jgi:predicted enzyme related to lactoylglutathione lyase
MAKIENHTPGSFCWAELATSDLGGAKKFYNEMFGWTVLEQSVPGGVYVFFQSEGNDAAAIHAAQPGVPTHWGVYFSVAGVDDSAAKIAPSGGKILAGPFDVMDAGRMVVAQDPQGAAFSLWQPKAHIGFTHGGPLNQVCWPELTTPDPAGAVAFYSGLLGWKTKPDTGLDAAQYIEWINGQTHIGGLMPMRGDEWKGIPPHWMVYVSVADCDERAAKAKQLGATICVPPTDIPNVGRFSVITDAQGAVFSLVQLTATGRPVAA